MPRNRSNPAPPLMTWAKAIPLFAVAGIFDALRGFFTMFWFFGPLLFGTVVATVASSYVGSFLGGGVGAVATIVVGTAGAKAFIVLGVILAMAVGLLGWLTIALCLLMFNARIFKVNATQTVWFVFGLGVGEIPLVGAIPALTGSLWRLYSQQIKADKAAYAVWQEEERKLEHDRRNQEAVMLLESELAQQQAEEMEARASNDNDEIHEEEQRAA